MKPTLRRILRDERTLQLGVHPFRAVMLSGLTQPVLEWVEGLDGTRDLETVLREAALAGLDELRARSLLDQLAAQGALHDAATGPGSLRDLPLAERDRLKPELSALDLASTSPDGMIALFERRRRARVRVYGAGRVGAQIVALLAAAGVGHLRVLDPGETRPQDLTPGGLTWAEVGLSREVGAVAVARRFTSAGHRPLESDEPTAAEYREALDAAGVPPNPPALPDPPRPPRVPTRSSRTAARPPARVTGTAATSATPPRPSPVPPGTGARTASPPNPRTPSPPNARTTPSPNPRAPSQPNARTAPPPNDARALPSPGAGTTEERCRPTVKAVAGGTFLGDRSDRPDLVILAPVDPMDLLLVNDLNSLRIPHLLVSAFEGHGTVGPLVLPGDTACLHCLDLTRRDRDPYWPIVTARLGGYPPGEIACDVALATVVAAQATGHALAFIDGKEPAVTNGTMDVTPDWRWRRRPWKAHPQCRCMRNNPYSLRMVMAPDRD
ncbi:ThiF family adenylyltransferase [Nonomuraea gerenzanensis]|uniref:Molybdopterin biosynthesis protein MoeB n=1 Tax=Nonomuraea gerenzanensis TaxID=93944 RepID=A0A1M4EPE2_9ACTN|nr:ThiF family adenylyltransferase [Nonomuraea gerenzanensis]UBU12167.1 hypothetical protein LCN96_49080 [Nonomuraea gerenzanensis]SBP00689.1 Molybdopterin biosynthesis protein MoeB [Nonomuraea gerenzanensis]